MTNKYIKKVLNIISHQKNTTENRRHHKTPTIVAKFKKEDTPDIDEDERCSELSIIAVDSLKWSNHFGKCLAVVSSDVEQGGTCLGYTIAVAWQVHLGE